LGGDHPDAETPFTLQPRIGVVREFVAEFAEIKPTKYIDPQGFQQIFRLFSNCEQFIDRLFHLPDRFRLSETTDLKPLMASLSLISS
jgi:hypothetical protein